MSRHISALRRTGGTALVLVGALVLAGCGTTTVALSAVGVPSLSLNAPLTAVACTVGGSCVALGASGSANTPTTAAQVRNHKGVWSALNTPEAPVASFYSGSCAVTTCLFGGTGSSGELLWSINANTGRVTTLAAPAGGAVIRRLSCSSDTVCTAIDATSDNLVRVSQTTNGGATWGAPHTLAWARSGVSALDCVATNDCFASATDSAGVTLRQTLDGGVTWTVIATPTTWTSLTSLQCSATTCTALVNTASGSSIATQAKVSKWKESVLSFTASGLSCASPTRCLAIGHVGAAAPAMAQWTPGGIHSVALTYVPSALTDVACQPAVCVAIGVSTVVSLRP